VHADVLKYTLAPYRILITLREQPMHFYVLTGQKQRVALARAVYANPDLALLDDCFSALDANTAKIVFDRLFSSTNDGVLRKSGTILVTHALHLLPSVDLILVMKNGSPAFLGSWIELQQLEEITDGISPAIIHSIIRGEEDAIEKRLSKGKLRRDGIVERDGIIMTVEEREYGVASFAVWVEWFKGAGGWSFFLSQMLLLCLDRGFYIASDW
jgi:ABC-type multidrug transport system ATPase subunit